MHDVGLAHGRDEIVRRRVVHQSHVCGTSAPGKIRHPHTKGAARSASPSNAFRQRRAEPRQRFGELDESTPSSKRQDSKLPQMLLNEGDVTASDRCVQVAIGEICSNVVEQRPSGFQR